MIKHVLVHVDGTAAGKVCLNYAIALSLHLDARLTGIHVRPPADVGPLYKPSQIRPALKRIEDRAHASAEAAAACFWASVIGTDLKCDWHSLAGDMADVISKASRFADLTVLSQSGQAGPPLSHPLSLAEVTLIKCPGPILIVPEQAEPVIPVNGLVSWDGSRQAARALHNAIPLIQGCRTPIKIACDAGTEARDLGPLVEHLRRHGVTVSRSAPKKTDPARSGSPLEQRRNGGFDLMIMGAFRRAPWREILFGGQTLTGTRKTGVPVLASH